MVVTFGRENNCSKSWKASVARCIISILQKNKSNTDSYGGPDSAFEVHDGAHLVTLIYAGYDRDGEKTINIRVTLYFHNTSTVDRNVK